jgi:leader peptidase (prepilin peptidase)/N-methyltransferase
VTGRAEWGAKIPFGPYLALGALLWLFYGPEFFEWYLNKMGSLRGA